MYLSRQADSESLCIYGVADNGAMSIGHRIKEARSALGMSQAQLAKRVGVSQGTIGHIEAGRNDTSKHLVVIAAALGVRAEWLQTGRGQRAGDWPFPGVTPDAWASLPEDDKQEILMLVRAKIERYKVKSNAA